jgi:hypothetical protein
VVPDTDDMSTPSALRVFNFIGAGILVGVIAFLLSAGALPHYSYLGPVGIVRMIDDPGFDPWTGMGHGRIYELAAITGNGPVGATRVVRERGFRTWLGTRHAIPVPLGAGLTWTALAVTMLVRRRREA